MKVAVVVIGVIYLIISTFMFYAVYCKTNHVADVSKATYAEFLPSIIYAGMSVMLMVGALKVSFN